MPPMPVGQCEQKPCARMALGCATNPAPSSSSAAGTVPRKRRPRAVGEVSVSSTSSVYLYDPNDPFAKPTGEESHPSAVEATSAGGTQQPDGRLFPVYENFADESRQRNRSAPRCAVPVLPLTVVRVRHPERATVASSSCATPDAPTKPPEVPPRRKHAARAAVSSVAAAEQSTSSKTCENYAEGSGSRFELQSVSTFLGDISHCYQCSERASDGYCVVGNVSEPFEQATYPQNETSIWIRNSTVPAFNRTLFAPLGHVAHLMIHRLAIEQLELDGCDALEVLFASYNAIERVSAVEGLPLRQLHLYHNQLTDVSALRALTGIEQLYLHDNLLESLRLDTFVPMRELKILTLQRNRLRTIVAGNANRPLVLPRLEQLFLQFNRLPHLDTGLWRMERLRVLDLSHNQLGYLLTFLEELPALRTLGLHHNPWHCGWLFGMLERVGTRELDADDGSIGFDEEASCPGLRLDDRLCCQENATTPDPVLLLVSRTGIVDELQQQLRGARRRIETLEEAQRKQTHQFGELAGRLAAIERLCAQRSTDAR
uniref:Leucine rich immune protein (Short) n=1 Tax=Anopheles stephensi TaxID=30069 RepID=A0A182XYU9_ANOST